MKAGFLRGALAALLALCLAVTAAPLPALATDVDAAPLTVRSAATNGMVRVYLSSLGSPTQLDITVSGSYTLGGNTSLAMSSGETVRVTFDTQTGMISLTRNGQTTAMGQEVAFRRHATSGTSGLKIAQARKSGNLYPGDLYLKAQKSGSGYRLYPIVHVYIEYYLNGVLPYEMGSSAPMEALKAQAVAARTYTLNKMNTRASSLYDVVDTTNDQVYYGNSDSTANCTAAVTATKGIVLTNGGKLTSCYYTASNGGQTESAANAWGSSGYSYLTVKDDPFDLMNTAATVRSATIYADYDATGQKAGLTSLLNSKAQAALSAQGTSGSIAKITGVTPHTPKFASPSRLYSKVDFDVVCQTPGGDVSLTLTCNIFTELETALGLGINGSANELWSVKQSGSNWILQARRYGHGVGMSQRGAMQMASMGYTYDQILGFYYENSVRVQYTFTHTILSPVESGGDDVLTSTEEPAEITGGDAYTATVKLIANDDRLAIRSSASESGQILTSLVNGALVSVISRGDSWTQVKYGDIVGYVQTSALTFQGTPTGGTETAVTTITGYATVSVSGTLNLRESASTSARVVTTIPDGAVLPVFEQTAGWAKVQYGAQTGYASTDFLVFSATYPGQVADPDGNAATVTLASGSGSVNLRASASTSAQVLAQLPHGTVVTALRNDGAWCRVYVNGTYGYIMTSYLTFGGSTEPPVENTSPLQPGEVEAVVQCIDATLPLFAAADASSAVLAQIPRGESIVVTQRATPFSQVRYGTLTGYVATVSLTFPGDDQSATIQSYARVTTASGSLNLRALPQTGSRILRTIPRNSLVGVLEDGSEWCRVIYESSMGYVMRSFLTFENQATDSGDGTLYAVVTTPSGTLNLRAVPSRDAHVLCTIEPNTRLPVLEKGASWSQVNYGGVIGYVMNEFLVFEATQPTATPEATVTPVPDAGTPTPTPLPTAAPDGGTEATALPTAAPGDVTEATALPTAAPGGVTEATALPTAAPGGVTEATALPTAAPAGNTATVVTGGGSLNLRASGSTAARILVQIPEHAQVTVLASGSIWSQVSWNGFSGYVMTKYLSQGSVPTGSVATVYTVSGSLNLRQSASTGAKVLARIPRLQQLTVLESGTVWCKVSWSGMTGYVQTQFLRFDSAPTATPGTTATPVPGGVSAWVWTPSGSLNLRENPSIIGRLLRSIPRLAELTVLQQGSGWCLVSYQGTIGYVMSTYLTYTNPLTPSVTPAPGATGGEAWVWTPSGSLNLRESPSTDARILRTIPRLAELAVLQQGTVWCQVTYQGLTGYVQTQFLTFASPQATATATPSATPAPTATGTPGASYAAWVLTPSGNLNLRESPSTDAKILRQLSPLSLVTVYETNGAWARISYQDVMGYVQTQYLTTNNPSQATATPTPGVTHASAWVSTPSGGLNLRESASTTASVLRVIPQHAQVTVHNRYGEWVQVDYQGTTGYVQAQYLTYTSPAQPTATATTGTSSTAWVLTPSGELNLRQEGSLNARILCTIPRLAEVTLYSWGTSWSYVAYQGIVGYVQSSYLTLNDPGTGNMTTPVPTSTPAQITKAWVWTAAGGLNLRESPSGDARILSAIPRLAQVEVHATANGWSLVYYDGDAGYVQSSFLTETEPPSGESATSTPASTAAPETAPATQAPTMPPRDPTLREVSNVTATVGDATIGLYPFCTSNVAELALMADGTSLTVLQQGDTWCMVRWEAQQLEGYCETRYLILTEGSAP